MGRREEEREEGEREGRREGEVINAVLMESLQIFLTLVRFSPVVSIGRAFRPEE